MSNQLQITGGAKVRNLEGVLTGTSGVVSSLGINVPDGVPQLDGSGKILVSQLPNSVMEYKGTWNAATNTPTLVDGTGNAGDVYLCNVAGTVNFGSGPITFYVGDQALYSGSIWQRASGASGTVTSVSLTESGDSLTITGSPITTSGTINIGFAGNSGQYINGEGNLTTFPSIITQAQNLVTEVYNETGATLSKGTVVYINGGHGNLPTITKALATSDATSAQTYGVVRADISNNNNGYVTVIGNLDNMDTQVYAAGTQLYLSSTTAGAYTSVKQYAPAHLVYVGIVTRSHPTQGVIEIKIQNGFEMDELHNVSAQSPNNNDILQYKTSTSLWTSVAGTTSNISEGTNLYFTDARARSAISLTTTGTSGASTYNSSTGVLNIPQYQGVITNPVTGVGSADQVAFWNSSSNITYDSTFYYSSSNKRLGVNTNTPNATIGANIAIDGGYGLLVKNADSNYNGLGIAITSNYGNVIATEKLGTASAKNLTLINQVGYLSLTEAGNFGLNILTPTASPSGVGSVGMDIYGGSSAAGLGFHNSASGVGNTNGAYIYLTTGLGFTLRNTEGSITSSSLGDFSVITNSTENFRVNASDGSLWQSNITSSLLKTNSSGVIVAAVAGTDYQTPITNPVSGTGTATRVAFWSASNTLSSNTNLYWDNTNARLGIGLTNPQRALEIYSSVADSHLRLTGAAPSVSMGEAITGSVYQAKFGLVTVPNQYLSGSSAGDFVMTNQAGNILFGFNGTEVARFTTGGLSIYGPKSQISITGNTLNGAGILLNNVISGVNRRNWAIFTEENVDGDFVIKRSTSAGGIANTTVLSLSNAGAATFSSSVQVGSTSTSTGGLLVIGGSSIGTANANNGQIYLGATSAYRGVISYDEGPGYLYIDNTYNNNSGNIYFRTKTAGTAINAFTILGSGNVGIGTSSPNNYSGFTNLQVNGTTNGLIQVSGASSTLASFYAGNGQGQIGTTSNHPFTLFTNDIERMRITSSGELFIGASSFPSIPAYVGIQANTGNYNPIAIKDTGTTYGSGYRFIAFYNSSSSIAGSIEHTGVTTTNYNTSSDKRLKKDLGVSTNSVIDNIIIHDFEWIEDKIIDKGVFAQELYEHKPLAVSVGKDDVTEDGKLAQPWGVDYSKLVPELIVYCQNQNKIIQKLEERIKQLENKLN